MIIRGKRDPAIYRRLWLSRRMEREKASSSGMGEGDWLPQIFLRSPFDAQIYMELYMYIFS